LQTCLEYAESLHWPRNADRAPRELVTVPYRTLRVPLTCEPRDGNVIVEVIPISSPPPAYLYLGGISLMRIRSAKHLTVLLSFLCFACSSGRSSRPAGVPGLDNSPISITAAELVQEYRTLGDGPGGADKKYKDKTLVVSGSVLTNTPNIGTDTIRVVLSGGEGSPYGVQCNFEGEDKAPLTQVKNGQTVTIQGKCDGRTLSVQLSKCKLLK
jgi:hypothetical protein